MPLFSYFSSSTLPDGRMPNFGFPRTLATAPALLALMREQGHGIGGAQFEPEN